MNEEPAQPAPLAYGNLPPGGRITVEQGEDSLTIVVRPPTLWRAVRNNLAGAVIAGTMLAAVAFVPVPMGRGARARLALTVGCSVLLACVFATIASTARVSTTFRVADGQLEVRRGWSTRRWRREDIAYVRAHWSSLNVRGRRHGTHGWFQLALSRDERAWLADALTRALALE